MYQTINFTTYSWLVKVVFILIILIDGTVFYHSIFVEREWISVGIKYSNKNFTANFILTTNTLSPIVVRVRVTFTNEKSRDQILKNSFKRSLDEVKLKTVKLRVHELVFAARKLIFLETFGKGIY